MAARAHRPGMDFRLRWWTLLLPAAAFTALLMLLVSGTDADAASPASEGRGGHPLTQLVQHIDDLWLP